MKIDLQKSLENVRKQMGVYTPTAADAGKIDLNKSLETVRALQKQQQAQTASDRLKARKLAKSPLETRAAETLRGLQEGSELPKLHPTGGPLQVSQDTLRDFGMVNENGFVLGGVDPAQLGLTGEDMAKLLGTPSQSPAATALPKGEPSADAKWWEKDYIGYVAGEFGAGMLSSPTGVLGGAVTGLGDLATGGKVSEGAQVLANYFAQKPQMLQRWMTNEMGVEQMILNETGVTPAALAAYRTANTDDWIRQSLQQDRGANLEQGFKDAVGDIAYTIGQQVPGMVYSMGAPASDGGGILNSVAGAIKNKSGVGQALASSAKSALKGNVNTWLLGGGAAGNQLTELAKQKGYDPVNYINAMGNGFVEYINEGLFGFSDGDSIKALWRATGSKTGNTLKSVARWLMSSAEEGLEEAVNVPMSGIVDKMTTEPDKKLLGEGGIFDFKEMLNAGIQGAVVGLIMGGVGGVSSIRNAVLEGADIHDAATAMNHLIAAMPTDMRPAQIDPKTATAETLADKQAEVLAAYKRMEEAAGTASTTPSARSTFPAQAGKALEQEPTQSGFEQGQNQAVQSFEQAAPQIQTAPVQNDAQRVNINQEVLNNGQTEILSGRGPQRGSAEINAGGAGRVERTGTAAPAGRSQSAVAQQRTRLAEQHQLTTVSSRELGLSSGTDVRRNVILDNESLWDDELRSIKQHWDEMNRTRREKYGYKADVKLQFVLGQMETVDYNGQRVLVEGFTTDDGTVCVCVNKMTRTATEIAEHEEFHVLVGDTPELAEALWPVVEGEGLNDAMVERYRQFYGETLGYNDQMVREEILADAYAGLERIQGTGMRTIRDYVKQLTGEAQEAIDQGWYTPEAADEYENVDNEGRETRGPPMYSIETLEDGRKYVRADRQVIFGNDPEVWGEQVEDYINGKIRRGEDVQLTTEDGDVLTLTAETAGKAKHRYNPDGSRMSDALYETKLNAETHIDELAGISRRGKTVRDYGERHGEFAKEGWNYRTAFFMDFDEVYYEVTISVAQGAGGNVVYNVGNIHRRSDPTINGSSAKRGAQGGNASSEDSVPQAESVVKERFSLSDPVEQTETLIALHNMDEEKLRRTLDLGAWPAPSIAIVQAEQGHTTFGDYSAIFPRSTIDPEADSRNRVYGSDAWTPTHNNAQTEYEVNYDARRAADDLIWELSKQFADGAFTHSSVIGGILPDDATTKDLDSVARQAAKQPSTWAAYLQDRGESLTPTYKEKIFDSFGNEALQSFVEAVGFQELARLDMEILLNHELDADAMERAKDVIIDHWIEKNERRLNQKPELREKRIANQRSRLEDYRVRQFIENAWEYYEHYGESSDVVDKDATSAAMMEMIAPDGSWDDVERTVRDWLRPKLEGVIGEAGIYNGVDRITDNGRRSFKQTHYPLTAENIVRAMYQQGTTRGEGASASAEGLASVATPEYESVESIHADEGRLRTEDEAVYRELMNELQGEIDDFVLGTMEATEAHSSNRYEEESIIEYVLMQAAGQRDAKGVQRVFRKEGYNLPTELAQAAVDLFNKAAATPTKYFEAKPERVVGFDEALALVAPDNAPEELMRRARDAGMNVITYTADDNASRIEAVNSVQGARFSVAEEVDSEYAAAYVGRSMADDAEIYSYEFLTALPDMKVVTLPDVNIVRNQSGKVDTTSVVSLGMKNARAAGTERDGKAYVNNAYTGRDIRIDTSSVRHGLNGNLNRILTNARLGAVIGEVVKNAVPINALYNTADGVDGTYAMAAYATDDKGREFVAIVTVEQRGNNVSDVDVIDVTHAVSGRQKNRQVSDPHTGSREFTLSNLSEISIADLLDVVNETYQSILSEDVLQHFGETKNAGGHYTDRVKFSVAGEQDGEPQRRDLTPGQELTRKEQSVIKRAINSSKMQLRDIIPAGTKEARETQQMQMLGLARKLWETGEITQEDIDDAFEAIWDAGEVVDRELADQYAELRADLKAGVTVSAELKKNITDFESFRRANFGIMTMRNGEAHDIDDRYRNWTRDYPNFFPESIKEPADQLERAAEIAQKLRPTKKTMDELYKGDWNTKAGMKVDFVDLVRNMELEILHPVQEITAKTANQKEAERVASYRQIYNEVMEEVFKVKQRETYEPDPEYWHEVADDAWNRMNERAAAIQSEWLRSLTKEGFKGTESLDALGVKIAGSVADYHLIGQILENHRAAQAVRRDIRKAERKLKATPAEKQLAAGIASGVFDESNISGDARPHVVMELADYYMMERIVGLDMIQQRRNDMFADVDYQVETLMRDKEAYKISSSPVLFYRTPQRNMINMYGREQGQKVYDFLFAPVAENEAERLRWTNRMYETVREIEGSDGKKKALNRKERALVQMVMEGRAAAEVVAAMEERQVIYDAADNLRNGQDIDDVVRTFNLTAELRDAASDYATWLDTNDILETTKGVDLQRIYNAADIYAEQYNKFYAAINDFLAAHGYEPIGFIKGYAPHIQPEQNRNMLQKALNAMGLSDEVSTLPTAIAGQTHVYRPNKRWNPHFLSRHGEATEYDVAAGYENYVDYLSDILFHTDDTVRIRRAANYFRRTYAPEEISNNLSWAEGLRNASPEQKAEMLRENGKLRYDEAPSAAAINDLFDSFVQEQYDNLKSQGKYSNFVNWLEDYANQLTGKQSLADRGMEVLTGRQSLNFANKLNRAFQQANVAGNVSTALNQTAQLPQIVADNGLLNTTRAMLDYAKGIVRRDGFREKSDFLTAKAGVNNLVIEPTERVINALFTPAQIADDMMSYVAVRGAYIKAVRQGMDDAAAMRFADRKGEQIMGSRAKGSAPQAFRSRNPVVRMVNMFQVEALNSFEYVEQDLIIQGIKDIKQIDSAQGRVKATAALIGLLGKMLVAAFLWNRATEELYGGSPAQFDLLGYAANFLASGNGLTANTQLLDWIDMAWERAFGEPLFDIDPEYNEEFDWENAVGDLGYAVGSDVPLVRNVMGLLGLGDQSLPMPDLSTVGDAAETLWSSGASLETLDAVLTAAGQFVPGGRQINKTYQGARAIAKGGRYYGYGENERLQYPVDVDFSNSVKALLFGPSGLSENAEFYAAGGNGLSAKQTQNYQDLMMAGLSSDMALEAYREYQRLNRDETLTAQEKATEMAKWTADNGLTEEQAALAREAFTFFNIVPAETTRYDSFTAEGLDANDAYALTEALDALEPEEGETRVRNLQRYRAVLDHMTDEAMRYAALAGVMQDKEFARFSAAYEFTSADAYVGFLEAFEETYPDESKSQERVESVLRRMNITNVERAAIWQACNTSWKPKNNPFSENVGREVSEIITEKYAALTKSE